VCHYCGCRQVPLIRDYIAEHEEVTDLGGRALRALGHDDVETAHGLVARMREVLRSHWEGEENGVFTVMARHDELYADYVAPLVQEHRDLEAFLAAIDLTNGEHRARLRREMEDLAEHISREEDGLFPATLVTLSGDDWDTSIAAWEAAHPGQRLDIG
jgi:iron-sulfur cluster repair protein YtfE (RIC family)